MSKDLVQAMQILEEEKGISSQIIKEALESALVLAYKKRYDNAQNVEVEFNEETGLIKVFSVKEVVETKYDPTFEISLEEALEINRAYEIGDKIKFEVTPNDFGRIATQTAKHVVMQRIREAERDIIYNEFIQYEDEILTGTVERYDKGIVYINLDKVEAVMPIREQIVGEHLEIDQRVKVYVSKIEKTPRGPQVVVSRAHPDFLRRLFEQEVPEIYDGIVEIVSISREAGDRSKVAVRSRDENIDPVGTCVGQKGQRVQTIVNELNGENMDIIEHSEDAATFIRNAMSPAEVINVIFEEEGNSCIVVVPDYQLSLAIGKKGQNARLAARLTSHKIDIKSESAYEEYLNEKNAEIEEDFLVNNEEELTEEYDAFDEAEIISDVAELEDIEEQESVVDQIEEQDIDENNYNAEAVEDAISEIEHDHEQNYEELLEEHDEAQDEL
ncbi:transcription termination/antitermination protein NusA [Aerococcaceae bacterium DSM 111021]|nr:transcription termination/antitermination protein NusA [Aerococcaceae bacterium DSM 111021]